MSRVTLRFEQPAPSTGYAALEPLVVENAYCEFAGSWVVVTTQTPAVSQVAFPEARIRSVSVEG